MAYAPRGKSMTVVTTGSVLGRDELEPGAPPFFRLPAVSAASDGDSLLSGVDALPASGSGGAFFFDRAVALPKLGEPDGRALGGGLSPGGDAGFGKSSMGRPVGGGDFELRASASESDGGIGGRPSLDESSGFIQPPYQFLSNGGFCSGAGSHR